MKYSGVVVSGRGLASVINVPTANIAICDTQEEIDGVWAARVWYCGRLFEAATFVDLQRLILEANLLDFSGDLTGQSISVFLIQKIRERKSFVDMNEAKQTISQDIQNARQLLDKIPTRVMVFGTFDIVHKGHENMFEQARALCAKPYLIVSVAQDSVVERVKGAPPRHSAEARMSALRQHCLVDEVVLGDAVGYMPHIVASRPEIIALGYDQYGEYVDNLRMDIDEFDDKIIIVRLDSYKSDIYKTSKLL